MTSVFISPRVRNHVVGGVARVIEAQKKWLPAYGIEVMDEPTWASVLACHISNWVEPHDGQRVVIHCHGLYWEQDNWNAAWYHEVNAATIDCMRRSDAITCPSEWVADSLRRGGWFDPVVIGHGIDLDEWAPQPHNGYVLWDKARVDSACDPRALNVLAQATSNIRYITTFGDETRNVRVTGELPYAQHKEVMQHAGLYLATARETFGISVLEALASGVPVVGWNWGGQADIVDSTCGYLVTPGDYAALVRATNYCLEHRAEMSQAARQLVADKYQWRTVIGAYANLYEAVAANRPPVRTTVVIPSYNLSRYLPQAIESALMQKDTEVIVVDDCSTDDSLQVARGYEQRGVRVLQTPHNSNMPGVLNLGIEAARGEYIVNLDADNTLPPGACETLSAALSNNRDLDIVYGRIKFVLDDGETPDTQVAADGISRWPPQVASYEQQMAHRNQIPSSAMFRKKLWQQVGGYRHRCFRIGEDPDFWCRALGVGAKAVRITDAVTLTYRMREDSRSHVQPEWPWEKWYPNKLIQQGAPVYHYNMRPKVSVIIPVGPGHGTQGLEDALDSVYAQSFREWEVIVVNDTGSPLRWLPSWARSYNTNSTGAGVSITRNIGISAAKGDTFVLLDADDYLEPTALEKMYTAWTKYGGYVYTDWYKDGQTHVQIESHRCVDQLQHLYHPITCLYPIEVRDSVKFDEAMRVGEDWDYVLAVLAGGWCGTHVSEPLVNYRQASGSNRNEMKQRIGEIRAYVTGKWGDKMACGCSKGGGNVATYQPEQQQMATSTDGELVLLEYMADTATMSWTGPVTGRTYRFGSGAGHNLGYVQRADAVEFLKRPEFELAGALT